VEVRAVSAKLLDTEPGGILSLSFRVTNNTTREEEFIESLKLPPNWQALVPPGSFTLPPSEAEARVVAFSVPRSAAAAYYEVAYSVRSQRDYGIQDADTVIVVVWPVGKIALLLEEKPDAVIAGQEYQAKLRLINQGNAAITLKLEVKSGEKYPAHIDPAEAALPAGEGRIVIVTVKTNKNENAPRRHFVHVKAQAVGVSGREGSAALAIGVDIIPRVTGKVDLRHRIPAELTLRANAEDGEVGLQAELSGSGTLDEAGTKEVDFLFRGPDTQDKGTFGLRDEYWLNYSTADFAVRLGDQSYGLSPLTGYYRYGRGLALSIHRPDRLEFGAYYLTSRWERPQSEEAGAFVSSWLNDGLKLRLNFLHKERSALHNDKESDDRLCSLEATVKPRDDVNLHLEYARSRTNRGGGARDDAYRIEADGRAGKGTYYSFSKIHAGPDYYGYYRDADYTQGAISFPLPDRMQAHASYRMWDQNLSLRPYQTTAPKEALRQVGINYTLPSRWRLSVDYEDFRHRDLLQPADYDYKERALRLSLGRSSDRHNFRLDLRGGKQEDLLRHQRNDTLNCSVYASYRPTRRQSFTLYGGAGGGNAQGSRLLGCRNNIGASVSLAPTDGLRLRLYCVKYGFNSRGGTSEQLDFRLSYALPDESAWTLHVRRSGQRLAGQGDTSCLLSYTIPLGLPVGRKKSLGLVKGKVYDAQLPHAPGISGAILTAGSATAVTNKHGQFTFPALAPGSYVLRLDRGSIGFNRVPQRKLPLEVEVEAGKVTQFDIGVTQAACVLGTVTVARAKSVGAPAAARAGYLVGDPLDGKNSVGASALANALVELSDGDEALRRLTNHKGQFLFDDVRPGNWHLKVYEHNLPAFHYLERPEMDLELAPGERKEVSVKVLARLRRIRMIDGGEISVSSPQPATPGPVQAEPPAPSSGGHEHEARKPDPAHPIPTGPPYRTQPGPPRSSCPQAPQS